jgi:hypothetical protein
MKKKKKIESFFVRRQYKHKHIATYTKKKKSLVYLSNRNENKINFNFRSSMTQWPIQRNIYTLVPQTNPMNKSNQQQETPHILTTHNTNTPRISPPTNHHISQQQSSTLNTYDDSLTNLSWLHDINILKRTMPAINSSSSITNNKRKERPSNCISSSSNGGVYPNDISDNNELPISNDDDNDDQWRMYKTNPQAKPVYSYSQLILLAMKQSGYDKMTLQMIYEWVAENFPYFKKMEPTWQVCSFLKFSIQIKTFLCFYFRILFDIIYH